jgi:hypothetical protein
MIFIGMLRPGHVVPRTLPPVLTGAPLLTCARGVSAKALSPDVLTSEVDAGCLVGKAEESVMRVRTSAEARPGRGTRGAPG